MTHEPTDQALRLLADAVGAVGGPDSLRLPQDDAGWAAFVQRVGPERERLEAAVEIDPADLGCHMLLGLLRHCEGAAEAADALDAAADRLAALGVVPSLVADLRFHAGLARLRRLEGAGEADGDGG